MSKDLVLRNQSQAVTTLNRPAIVLDEDTYTDAISYIIERDFFPNLAKLRAQQEYFHAEESGDLVRLQQAGRELKRLTTTPRTTRLGTSQSIAKQAVVQKASVPDSIPKDVDLSLSLDQFQARYTSEDNASFIDLLGKANEQRKEKHKWVWDKESNQLRIKEAPHVESALTIVDERDALPGTWKYKARNALMYQPDVDSLKTKSSINPDDGRGSPKAVIHANTQFDVQNMEISNANKPQSVRDAQSGKMTPWNKLSGDDDMDMPEFGGYNLVPESPSINPSSLNTPLMTWGEIEGTPMLIAGSETPGPNSFRLPQPSRREQLGHKLSERASKSYRTRAATNQAGKVTKAGLTPRFGSGIMSPAAQHLLRKGTDRTPSFNDALRASYGSGSGTPQNARSQATPTPLFRAGSTRSFATPTPIQKR
ncbi:hypothetical protein K450DRAFT_273323 [Umbelopsis ramanniana AG]|uniref:Uncharacterized protein n=1 Tax=Umbelopsis ramanniana AG TaxID=1314678 RepID=A0AAD5E720_UMBRA|nr:uncharacterized protein K450DRAFT_273323 [Umbelopsis ramanniana AG]KAI8577989.1 hypothetical protein K450DRAFT_273323 [Umbelopsis ramanniana AG]